MIEYIELPGVVRVMRNSFYQLQTTRSWDFLGLQLGKHNNPNQNDDLLYKANMGDGVIIGVFDTGEFILLMLNEHLQVICNHIRVMPKKQIRCYSTCWGWYH